MAFKASPSSQHQHCTDEAQKAETVLSAVSYIYIYIYIYSYGYCVLPFQMLKKLLLSGNSKNLLLKENLI